MIDRADCWRDRCYARAAYVTADVNGVALCAEHAAEVAGEVRLTPIEAREALPRLIRRDMPRSPAQR